MYYRPREHGVLLSRLLAIDNIPVRVPDCYANPRLTDALVDKKLKIFCESILKFIKSKPRMFEKDCRKAGAVAKALQSRQAPVIIDKKGC